MPWKTNEEQVVDVIRRPTVRPGASLVECLRPGGVTLTDRALQLAEPLVGSRILDVGCGTGATVAHYVDDCGLRATGLDVSVARLSEAREARPDLDFIQGQAEALPFGDASLDAVSAECVLSLLGEPAVALVEVRRVLCPGGSVLVTDLYERGTHGRAPAGRSLPSLGTRATIAALFAGADLRMEAWEDHTGALARLLWDLAGSGVRLTGTAGLTPAASSSRRLGYFVCVARVPGVRREPGAGGVRDAGS